MVLGVPKDSIAEHLALPVFSPFVPINYKVSLCQCPLHCDLLTLAPPKSFANRMIRPDNYAFIKTELHTLAFCNLCSVEISALSDMLVPTL